MVIVNYGDKKGYIDGLFLNNIRIYQKLVKQDRDNIGIYCGEEREGKSRMMNKTLKFLDPTYNLDRCAFNGKDFLELIRKTKEPYKGIGWDEAQEFTSRASISKFNKTMVQALSLIGAKNLYIGICLPSFFELEKYAAIHRSHFLIRVYSVEGERGRFEFWGKEKKKLLYLKGKKAYDYKIVKPNFRGRFTKDPFPFDEKEYQDKKMDAMESGLDMSKEQESKWKKQRDISLKYMHEVLDYPFNKLSKLYEDNGYGVAARTIAETIANMEPLVLRKGGYERERGA